METIEEKSGKRKFDRRNAECYNCQKFEHFADKYYDKKKDPHEDEVKLSREENNDENTLLMVITDEGFCSQIQTSGIRIPKLCVRLPTLENVLVTPMEDVECSDKWYLDSWCSTNQSIWLISQLIE